MSKCTAAQAVAAMENWVGYYEKASSSYATTRDKSAYTKNKGSANYTFAGYLCGTQGQAWCAAQVSLAIYDACGRSSSDAKAIMYGVWPYVNCAQVWDAAPASAKYWGHYQRWTLGKGYRTTYYPKAGDIIVFTDNCKSRSHTGMVYACDKTYVYTIEGNSGNMCRKRSYLLTSSYIYGWIRPNYAASSSTSTSTSTSSSSTTSVSQYGTAVTKVIYVCSSGMRGEGIKSLQILLNGYGYSCGSVDGIFGAKTKSAVIAYQGAKGLTKDGIVGANTWAKLFASTASANGSNKVNLTLHTLSKGVAGNEVKALQILLNGYGCACGTPDGSFGPATKAGVLAYQKKKGLTQDGIVGANTWAKLLGG